MARVDWEFLLRTDNMLKKGYWDTNDTVRTKWEDGTPAHTVKGFSAYNLYDMREGFPISTLRKINGDAAIDEVQWIWQLKSNNVKDLHSHIWDQWADENGSIGKAYGWQVAQKSKYSWGEADQTDMVLHELKFNPASRRILTELFKHEDLHAMRLEPCVHGMQLDVAGDTLNMFLNQRSNDTLAAGNWNVVQYSALLHMLAQVSGLKPGVLAHEIVNPHIYDRHVPFIVDITLSRAKKIEELAGEIFRSGTKMCNAIYNMTDEEESAFKLFINQLVDRFGHPVSYKDLIKQAQDLELENDKHDATFYENYAKEFVETPQFKKAEYIVETMIKYPEFEKAFNFCSPKLILDPSVTNFYDFKSPLTTDKETGKFVPSEDSSFKVEDYNWKEEGIKLQCAVPVAE